MYILKFCQSWQINSVLSVLPIESAISVAMTTSSFMLKKLEDLGQDYNNMSKELRDIFYTHFVIKELFIAVTVPNLSETMSNLPDITFRMYCSIPLYDLHISKPTCPVQLQNP